MKKYIMAMIGASILLTACGDSEKEQKGALNDKKIALEKLKKEQADLNAEIRKLEGEIAELDTSAAKMENAKLVTVMPLGSGSFEHFIELQGKIDAENVAYVSPRLGPGLVKSVHVTEGQQVRKGQLLLKLDDAVQRQQVQTARSGLKALEVQLATARDVYNRRQNLWKQGIGAELQVIESRTAVETLEAQLASLRQQVQLAQESVNGTNVYAEISGVADEVNIRPGETFTGMGATGPQIRIVNTSSLKATVEVPENYLGRVKPGASVIVNLPDINKEVTGKVIRSAQLINPSTRAFAVDISIPSDPSLRPNQIAQVKIQDYATANTIAIPVNTVQNDEKGKYVYVAAKEGDKMVARKKPIGVGELTGDRVEVKFGLTNGDQLITTGYQNLYEGQVIKIVK